MPFTLPFSKLHFPYPTFRLYLKDRRRDQNCLISAQAYETVDLSANITMLLSDFYLEKGLLTLPRTSSHEYA